MIDSCKICKSTKSEEIFNLKKGVFSDGNILNNSLIKIECSTCGTIRTKLETDLTEFYKLNYLPSRNIDTLAVSNNQELSRSDFIFNWIKALLEGVVNISNTSGLLEIGCGQGFLLDKFNVDYKFGIEPSIEASKNASKIANVRNIGYEEIDNSEKYDYTLSYCVIEHIDNPNSFLEKNYNILSDNGIMIIALPIQDKFNYDLLFVDHIYHFNHQNFKVLLKNNGFEILNYQLGKESYSNIGMYICRKVKKNDNQEFRFIKNRNISNIEIIFKNINNIIKQYKNSNLYGFGYGEISKTILPYTELDQHILKYIDDYSIGEKVITSKLSKKIFNSNQEVNLILLVNPIHSKKIVQLYEGFSNINFINLFENISMER